MSKRKFKKKLEGQQFEASLSYIKENHSPKNKTIEYILEWGSGRWISEFQGSLVTN